MAQGTKPRQSPLNSVIRGDEVGSLGRQGWLELTRQSTVSFFFFFEIDKMIFKDECNRWKQENCMIIIIDTDKAFDKIQHPFLIKILSKPGIEGNLNLIKCASQKTTANIVSKGESMFLPWDHETMQGSHLLPLIFNSRLAALSTVIRQEREIQTGKEELKLKLSWF